MTPANWITLFRLLLALIGAFILSVNEPPDQAKFSAALFILSISLDKLDGMIARKYNCCANFGEKFDIAADKIIVAVFFLCLLDLRIISRHLMAALLIRDLLTQAFRNYALSKGIALRTYRLSKIQYIIQCISIATGILSFAYLRMNLTNPLRRASIVCFVTGLALGYLVLWNLVVQHGREVLSDIEIHN
jgi:CDP-diacylglycerol--glycerol-3-phosphate 3-phosphatidyltransferase